MMRSNPIAIRRIDSDDENSSDGDDGGVVHSFQQLVLEQGAAQDGEFCVGSLPTTNRRRARLHHQQKQFGTSLPAAPVLRSTRTRMTPSIPPISLTESEKREESTSPSYGSLRESQLAKRFLDGPSSYREKGSNEIKQWSRVRFQQQSSPGERMHGLRDQTDDKSSSLSALLSTTESSGPTSSFVDTEYSLQQEDVLSTSLTGLELLQRGLSAGGADDRPPDASHLSSWSSSGNNTYENASSEQEDVYTSTFDIQNHMSPLPDDEEEEDDDEEEEEDESPMFDLDME
jgi:hypothetical protein